MYIRTLLFVLAFSLYGLFVGVHESAAQTSCPVTPVSANTATYTVNIPETSTYTFWARMIAPDTSSNSFFLQVDGGCAYVVGDNASLPANQFTWVNYQDGNTANPITMVLAAGTHTILVTEREGGTGIDSLFFSNTPCIPTGFGENCQGFATYTPAPPTNTPIPSPTPMACVNSTVAWQNTSIPTQTGVFTATFFATPNNANMDGVLGFSNGAASSFTNLAAIIRFNESGFIDARNGGSYQAATSVAYTPGTQYAFRMVINVSTRTYSVYGRPVSSSTEQTIANNYTFRSEQASVTALSNMAMISNPGTLSRCSLVITQPTPTPTLTPTPTRTPTPTPLPTNTPTPTPLTQTYTLYPIADSYVNSNASGTNYGTRTTMVVDSSPTNISYLKFDLTPLAGKTIVSANFRLRTGTDGSSNQHRVKSVSSTTWTETGIKYSNRPSLGSTLATISSGGATNTWQQVAITSTVAAKVGSVFSLGIDSGGSDSITFSTRETTYKPELVIQAR